MQEPMTYPEVDLYFYCLWGSTELGTAN